MLCEQSANMVRYSSSNQIASCPVRLDCIYDENLPAVKIIPRDISRVLINILNNAYYEVNRKWKHVTSDYEPKVSISTQRSGDFCTITIQDNGAGISPENKDRVFEPFFTTKPTGEGVGLGLSISNDIIAAHGGKISIETSPGEYSRFIIQLPM